MNSEQYWQDRQVRNMYHYMQGAEETADQIADLYYRASRYLSFKADDIYEKFKKDFGLSEKEVMRLLNMLHDKTSLDELLQKLSASPGNQQLKTELSAPAYQARLDRIRQLQNQIDMVMENVYQQEKLISTNFYVDLASEAYYRQIYDIQQRAAAAFSFSTIDSNQIDQVVNSKWSGENYSTRIWKNTKALAQDVKKELLLNLVTGRTNREVAQIIANKYAQSASNARRLVRTESNYIATEENFRAYEEAGIEKYRYLATLDLKTSKVCRELDGKVYLVKDRNTGVNCPPMHPWCRSTTTAYFTEELQKHLQRTARDQVTGKAIKVPGDMTYEQWYEKYVKGKPEAEATEKAVKNKSTDRKQHERYRKIL